MTRLQIFRTALMTALCIFLCHVAPAAEDAGPSGDIVLIISVDGLRPDAAYMAKTPHIDSVKARGVDTVAKTIHPPKTLPSHTSMLTGLTFEQHGVGWNKHRPNKGPLGHKTLFHYTKGVGFYGAAVVTKKKLALLGDDVDHLIVIPDEEKHVSSKLAASAAKRVLWTPKLQNNGGVVFVHFRGPDTVGHKHGWMTDKQIAAIEDVDTAIGEILAEVRAEGLYDRTSFIITADHGGQGKGHSSHAHHPTPEVVDIPWIAAGPKIPFRTRTRADIMTYDTAATTLWLLDVPIPWSWTGSLALNNTGGTQIAMQ